MKTLISLFLFAVASVSLVLKPVTPRESSSVLFTDVLVLPQSEFTVSRLTDRFQGILEAQIGKAQVLLVEAFDNKEAGANLIKYGSDVNYETWESWYREYKIPVTAELLRIGPNAAMRLRDPAGNLASHVLSGSDPYILEVDGIKFHLLHLIASNSARLDDFKSPDLVLTLHFFLLARGDLSDASLKAVTETLENSTRAPQLTVAIRRDPWFMSSVDFPIVAPFWDVGKPPTKSEYEISPEWYCHATPIEAHCSRSR